MRRSMKNDKGSTLLLVVIAICFIGILGSLILAATVTNIEMKQVDYQSKTNFYGTEKAVDELHAGLEDITSDCVSKAYNHVLLHYVDINLDTSTSVKAEFDKRYIAELVSALCGTGVTYDASVSTYTFDPGKLSPFINASLGTLMNNASSSNVLKVTLNTAADKISMVTLKNIRVKYYEKGYETIINTDINLESPNLDFSSSSAYPEYFKYALIADNQLKIGSGIGMGITGNLYAGADGIVLDATNSATPNPAIASTYNMKINGSSLITRGDINIKNSGKLFIGDNSNPTVWARNIILSDNSTGDLAYLNMNGNCKVEDDLVLGSKYSNATISGSYYGFSYNKDNKAVSDTDMSNQVNSGYSSSIQINGANSILNMAAARITIAGRAFISRFKDSTPSHGNDIMTGESVAIKSNQIAYLVPSAYIWCGHNPVTQSECQALPNGTTEVDLSKAPQELKNLLTTTGYTQFNYIIAGSVFRYYYLDFKNQACANKYFSTYYSDLDNKTKIDSNAGKYVLGNGIQLSKNLLLAGNALQIDSTTGKFQMKEATITTPDSPSASLLKEAIKTAMEYKSMELGLTSTNSAATSADFRMDDKKVSPLFKTIITQDGTDSLIAKEAGLSGNGFIKYSDTVFIKPVPISLPGYADCYVYIINNPSTPFVLNDKISLNGINYPVSNGIVIATGDLEVSTSYQGMIICGGTATVQNTGVQITADSNMVQNIFSYALGKERIAAALGGWDSTKRFTQYFQDYTGTFGGTEETGKIDLSKYITYENWMKN